MPKRAKPKPAKKASPNEVPKQSLLLSFTKAEYAKLETAAGLRSEELASWAREALLSAVETSVVPKGVQEVGEPKPLPAATKYGIYVGIFLGWLLLLFAATAGTGDSGWWGSWQGWDAPSFKTIATDGYRSNPLLMGIPPGFSVLVGTLAKIFHIDFYPMATAFNLLAFLAAAIVIAEWLSNRFRVPRYPLFLFVLFSPTSYFALSAYSDALFMLMLWASLWLALMPNQTRKTLIAQACLLVCMPWVRMTGYALAAWVLARKYMGLIVLVSLAAWLGFNKFMMGDPFYFKKAQEGFGVPLGGFLEGFVGTFRSVMDYFHDPNADLHYWMHLAFLPLFYLVILVAASAWLLWKREYLLGVTTLAVLFISHNYSFWRSSLRYDMPLLPVLCLPFLVNLNSRGRLQRIVLQSIFYLFMGAQLVLQLHFARLFHKGWWTF